MTIIKCEQCGKEFRKRVARQRFCSQPCYFADYYRDDDDKEGGLPTSTIGTIHELAVSVDLYRKGWHVLRALSPSCPFDIAAYKDPHLVRIQVTKAKKTRSGSVSYKSHQGEPFDHLAISFVDGKIEYIPPLPA